MHKLLSPVSNLIFRCSRDTYILPSAHSPVYVPCSSSHVLQIQNRRGVRCIVWWYVYPLIAKDVVLTRICPISGAHAAQVLAQSLPAGWRVVLIERNSHMNNLYVLPRFAVLPGHEYKAFVPLDKLFSSASALSSPVTSSSSSSPSTPTEETASGIPNPHLLVHAEVTSMTPHSVTLSRPYPPFLSSSPDGKTVHFDYLIYALGSHLPAPINLWAGVPDDIVEVSKQNERGVDEDVMAVTGTREAGIAWLHRFQRRVERARSVLVVGGGALGIRKSSPSVLPRTLLIRQVDSSVKSMPRTSQRCTQMCGSLCSTRVHA